MPYDDVLAQRVTEVAPDARSRKMFGGIGFFVDGNMFAGVMQDRLMVKLGAGAPEAVQQDGVEWFSPGGKPMTGWVTVDQELLPDDEDLVAWLNRGRETVADLPPKG